MLNALISDLNLLAVSKAVDIPVIVTVTKEDTDVRARLEAGASVLNIACGHRTCDVVRKIRADYPRVPLIASGGNTEETVLDTQFVQGPIPSPIHHLLCRMCSSS